ncbi:L,D-transpeptidase [Mycolicibacterium bacteremicum]|uniref:L,D-transpeptidase n=1 Tax=Mycolicibacterium bacteremicum TaxID=564198 RepID=UPI0026EFA5A9|nr:L,D-transpeptidase [Mycolicibacterium bacteremicum]
MSQRTRRKLASAILAAATVVAAGIGSPSALAEPVPPPPAPAPAPPAFPNPFAPPAPPATPTAADPFAPVGGPGAQPLPIPEGTPAGQNPNPFRGLPPFVPPSFNPVNGSIAGAAKPIYINFQRPIANRQMAQDAVHITSNPPVPGRFYWVTDTQLRWRPQDFWPAGAVVSIDAAGTKSSFTVPEQLVATVDDATKTMTVVRNGEVEKEFPVSMGKAGNDTKNGTYYVLEKFADMVMDSSTYGVPVDSADGYRTPVKNAVRIDNSGIFVHGAPWSEGAQGNTNVSHGCINLSAEDAKWFYDNFGSGDAVVIKNTDGGLYDQPDGASDWQMF